MITTKFNQVEEFEEELERDATDISRGIVRITGLRERDNTSLRTYVSVVSSYYLEGYGIVRMDKGIGYLLSDIPDAAPKGKPSNADVLSRYADVVSHITKKIEELGLVSRPGVYEVRLS